MESENEKERNGGRSVCSSLFEAGKNIKGEMMQILYLFGEQKASFFSVFIH